MEVSTGAKSFVLSETLWSSLAQAFERVMRVMPHLALAGKLLEVIGRPELGVLIAARYDGELVEVADADGRRRHLERCHLCGQQAIALFRPVGFDVWKSDEEETVWKTHRTMPLPKQLDGQDMCQHVCRSV